MARKKFSLMVGLALLGLEDDAQLSEVKLALYRSQLRSARKPVMECELMVVDAVEKLLEKAANK